MFFSPEFHKKLVIGDDIANELSKHSANLYYYGCAANDAEYKYNQLNNELEELKYNLIKSMKLRSASSQLVKQKDLTLTELTLAVKVTPSYKELAKKVDEARNNYENAKMKYLAIKEKGEMIRSFSLFKAQQLKTFKPINKGE